MMKKILIICCMLISLAMPTFAANWYWADGAVKLIEMVMKGEGISFTEAMERMHIPAAEQEKYRQYLDLT